MTGSSTDNIIPILVKIYLQTNFNSTTHWINIQKLIDIKNTRKICYLAMWQWKRNKAYSSQFANGLSLENLRQFYRFLVMTGKGIHKKFLIALRKIQKSKLIYFDRHFCHQQAKTRATCSVYLYSMISLCTILQIAFFSLPKSNYFCPKNRPYYNSYYWLIHKSFYVNIIKFIFT